MTLTQDRLKEVLTYEPKTGIFIRKALTSMRIKVGDIMNLHDWLLSVDAKRDGVTLYAAGREWKLQANTECEAWLLIEQESGGVLHEDIWAALPSEGWSVADGTP